MRQPKGDRINKRDTVFALLALGAASLSAVAQQQAKIFHVGFLAAGGSPESFSSSQYEGFRLGMRELGYVEGSNLLIEWRFAEGKYDRVPDLLADLVRLEVDVIVLLSRRLEWRLTTTV